MKWYEYKKQVVSCNEAVKGYITNLSNKLEEWQKTRTYGSTDMTTFKDTKARRGGIKSLFGFKR